MEESWKNLISEIMEIRLMRFTRFLVLIKSFLETYRDGFLAWEILGCNNPSDWKLITLIMLLRNLLKLAVKLAFFCLSSMSHHLIFYDALQPYHMFPVFYHCCFSSNCNESLLIINEILDKSAKILNFPICRIRQNISYTWFTFHCHKEKK